MYHSLENFRVNKVSWDKYSRRFNFVKQTPYEIILTQIFLDNYLIKMAVYEFECESCIWDPYLL